MRLRFFLAATLASLAIPPADAQIRLAVIDQPPSPAQVVSADVGTSTVPQAAPATPVRPVRPRIVRRVRRRPPPPAPKIGHLTLPSFDMTAPFSGGHTIATPTPDANPQAAPAPVVPVEEQTLAPASAAPAQQTPIQAPAPATADAPPALSRPSFTWIEPVANAPVPTILLRTAPDVGVAAFRAGSDILVVLDAPIDFRAPPVGLDAAFAQLTSHPTEDATVIRIPAASGTLSMAHSPRGWVVMEGAPAGTAAEIVPLLVRSGPVTTGIRFPAAGANRVVTVVNPQTGTRLLVGTQTATGQAVPNPWQQPKFDLLPTLQGIVVAAISDDMRLHADRDGFTLSTGLDTGGPIMQDAARLPSGAPIAAAMSLLFNIPNGTQDELAHDLQQRIRAASDAHLLARSESRLRVAETMLALGMDVEAQSVIDVAAAADPALMNTPRAIGLRAVAATLAGRFDDAKPLEDPRLDGSTEIEFWRGYLQASRDAATDQDAARLVQGLPLVLAYPQPLRDRLLPTTLETMALHGQVAQVQAALRGLPDDPTLDLARALALEMTNQPAAALQDYDRIAKGPDRLRRYQAELRAIDLRIKAGQLDAKAGADALDRDLYEWRGARQEQDLRSHIAALRRQAGQWPEALSVLREGRDAFPEDHARMDRELADTFTAFVTNTPGVALSRPELIALFDHNADLVRDIAWDEPTGQRLVDRLTDLGLQARAEPVLQRLVAQSTDPANRARLGARLADLRMTLDNQAGAIAALADTAPPANAAADPSVMETRQLLYAHAESQRGNTDRALTMLAALPTAQADAARADIYTGRKDWPHAEAALSDWEHKAIPTPAQLNDQQQSMVMRLAVAATLTSDSATLARLASTYGAAMQTGHAGAFFRLLTAAPVRDQDDLPRAFQEIQLAQQLVTHPADMETP